MNAWWVWDVYTLPLAFRHFKCFVIEGTFGDSFLDNFTSGTDLLSGGEFVTRDRPGYLDCKPCRYLAGTQVVGL